MKNKIKKIIISAMIFFLPYVLAGNVLATGDIENFENIPGQEKTTNFVRYLEQLYTFGIAIVGVLAIFMVSFGAFVYIFTSAGNASKMVDAKKMIYSAIFGLVLALVASLVLYLINPDLVEGTVKQFSKVSLTEKEVDSKTVYTSVKYEGYNKACSEEKQTDAEEYLKPIDFSGSESQVIASKCNDYDEAFKVFGAWLDKSGYDGKCILKAIAQMESSGCNDPGAESSKGCCGLMQLDPATAGVSCERLKKSPPLSIKKAAKYIEENMNGECVEKAKDKLSAIFAGYNGGYGCGKNACPNTKGKFGPLCGSNDCSSGLAFECCIKPGGLDQAIDYAWNGVRFYNYCIAK